MGDEEPCRNSRSPYATHLHGDVHHTRHPLVAHNVPFKAVQRMRSFCGDFLATPNSNCKADRHLHGPLAFNECGGYPRARTNKGLKLWWSECKKNRHLAKYMLCQNAVG